MLSELLPFLFDMVWVVLNSGCHVLKAFMRDLSVDNTVSICCGRRCPMIFVGNTLHFLLRAADGACGEGLFSMSDIVH